MSDTTIGWTDKTWNPVTGCTKVSAGCDNCYAEPWAARLQAMGQPNYRNGFHLALQPHMLGLPLRWKRPRVVFVNSMSDLFHKEIPISYISEVFDVMERADRHTYQVLTKRSSLMRKFVNERYPTWQGASSHMVGSFGRKRTGARADFSPPGH
jgi:protein gp37